MTPLALIAVLPAAAGRTLDEPGATCVPAAGLIGLCVPAPDLATAETARLAILAQHDRLVRIALAHDLVPVRSGAVFSGPVAVAAELVRRAATYRAHLGRVSGALELTVSVSAPAGVGPQTAPGGAEGLAYLRARRPRPSAVSSPAADHLLADALAAGAVGLPAQSPSAQGLAEAAATILVPRHRIAAVLAALGRWSAEVATPAGATVRLLGPWPCYTFTTAEVVHAAT
jgi:hypothetical protein